MSERIANASNIKHPSYTFEPSEGGGYHVTIMEGALSLFNLAVFKYELQQVNGSYILASTLRRFQVIYIESFYVLTILVGILKGQWLMILVLLLFVVFTLLLLITARHIAFNDIEHALRQAEYIKD
jgi:hypothetical protein